MFSAIRSILVLQLAFQFAASWIAYDCGAPTMNMTTFSLNDIKECDRPFHRPETTSAKIQLLQAAELTSVKVYQCKVEIKRSVFYCGMHSHISIVSSGMIEYISETPHDICQRAHKTRTYWTHNQVFTDLKINATTSRPLSLAGKTDSSGYCKGGQYSDFYGSWEDVVVIGQIFITLQEYYAKANVDKNELILRSGVRCPYTQTNCVDIEGGDTFWDLIPHGLCEHGKFTQLYKGIAQKVKDTQFNDASHEIYTLTSEDITFALTVKGQLHVCGYKLIKTEHPKLFIVDRTNSEYYPFTTVINSVNMDLMTYVNSKFVYLERHLKGQIIALYNDVIKQQCELEKQVLHNLLAIAPAAPAEFAYHFMKKPGYSAHVAGEVIRLAKCVPVEVKLRKTQQCFQELPIYRGNDTLFMMPRTHIIVKTGNQIECNGYLAPMFQINGEWIVLQPHVGPGTAPERISTQTKHSWQYTSPVNLAEGGIYSAEDLEKLRDDMMFPVEKPAILHTLAREMIGQDSVRQGLSIDSFLNNNTLEHYVEKAWKKLNGFFHTIGTYGTTAFGIYMCIRVIKFLIDTIVHGYALHTVFGWSAWLLGAIWDSVTHLLIHLSRQDPNNSSGNAQEGQGETTNSAPITDRVAPEQFREVHVVYERSTEGTSIQYPNIMKGGTSNPTEDSPLVPAPRQVFPLSENVLPGRI